MTKAKLKVKEEVIPETQETKPEKKSAVKIADEMDKLTAEGIRECQTAFMDWKEGFSSNASGLALATSGLFKLAVSSDLHKSYLSDLLDCCYPGQGEKVERAQRSQAFESVFKYCFGFSNYATEKDSKMYKNAVAQLRQVLPVVMMLYNESKKWKKPVLKHTKDGVEILTMLAFDENSDTGKKEIKKRKEYSEIDGESLSMKSLHSIARDYLGINTNKGASEHKAGEKPVTLVQWLSVGKSLLNDAENVTGSMVIQAQAIVKSLETFIEDNLELAKDFEAKTQVK